MFSLTIYHRIDDLLGIYDIVAYSFAHILENRANQCIDYQPIYYGGDETMMILWRIYIYLLSMLKTENQYSSTME